MSVDDLAYRPLPLLDMLDPDPGTFRPIIGLSGFVPTAEASSSTSRRRTDCRSRGADLTYEEAQMAHSIDPRFLATLPGWVEEATSGGA